MCSVCIYTYIHVYVYVIYIYIYIYTHTNTAKSDEVWQRKLDQALADANAQKKRADSEAAKNRELMEQLEAARAEISRWKSERHEMSQRFADMQVGLVCFACLHV